jgi:hypothetical protein
LWTLCPGWPPTAILPISASQLTRMTGVSHSIQLVLLFYMEIFTLSSIICYHQHMCLVKSFYTLFFQSPYH